MTHKERVLASLNNEPVDQLPCFDGLWGETRARYNEEGSMKEDEDFVSHFDTSLRCGGWLRDAVGQSHDFIAAQRHVSVHTVKGRQCICIHVKTAGDLADSFAATCHNHLIIRIRNNAAIVGARRVLAEEAML